MNGDPLTSSSNPHLQYGAQGGAVAWLSQVLGWWGYNPSPTDVYDWQTAEAVASLQRNYGYNPNGAMGPETWALIEALMQGAPAPPPPTGLPDVPNPQTGPLSNAPYRTGSTPGAPGGDRLSNMGRDALARLSTALNGWGLGGMIPWVLRKLEDSASEAEIRLEMFEQDAFKARFPIFDQRKRDNLAPVDVADVLEYEQRGRELLRRAGLTSSAYSTSQYLQGLMGRDLSLVELQDRINDGLLKVTEAPPEVRMAFTNYFGIDGDAALAELFLNPDIAVPELEKRAMTAFAGGIGSRFGVHLAMGIAREIADTGASDSAIWAGFKDIDTLRPLFNESISEQTDLTAENEGVGSIFGTRRGASETLNQRRESRKAQFSGGGGALGSAAEGVVGLGVADS